MKSDLSGIQLDLPELGRSPDRLDGFFAPKKVKPADEAAGPVAPVLTPMRAATVKQ
jgi:hypothetical protein